MNDLDGTTVLVTAAPGLSGSTPWSDSSTVLTYIWTTLRRRLHCRADDSTLIEGSLTDEQALGRAIDGADVVFHEAAQTSVSRSVEEPCASYVTNVDGTLAVLNATCTVDAWTVLASSATVYGLSKCVYPRGRRPLIKLTRCFLNAVSHSRDSLADRRELRSGHCLAINEDYLIKGEERCYQ